MEKYQLICMTFDGDFVNDFKGTIKECENVSADMGSKWYFYPFHFIVTEKGTVMSAGGSLVNMKTKEYYMDRLFLKRNIKTIQKKFKEAQKFLKSESIEVDATGFEEVLIELNQNLLR